MTTNVRPLRSLHYRTVWLSDVHLGSRACQARQLLDFLRSVRCDRLYLVGDIIDLMALRKGFYWPQPHNNVIRALLGAAKHGTDIIFVPGNHDAQLRDHAGLDFGRLRIRRQALHVTAEGKRYLVMHGDEFDSVVYISEGMERVGSKLYEGLVRLNQPLNRVRSAMGQPYWSLPTYLKSRVKNAVSYVSDFEHAVAREASKYEIDGVICGHIHRPELRDIGNIRYANCGDWVEHCSALVERQDGQLSLLDWSETTRRAGAASGVA